MNRDILRGNWNELKGKVKEQWGKLTDSQLNVIEGKHDQLIGQIQKSYGITKDEAERQVKAWEKNVFETVDSDSDVEGFDRDVD